MELTNRFVAIFIHKFVCFFKIVLIAALTHLGLLKDQQQGYADDTNEDDTINYVLLYDRECPVPIPVSVKTLTAIIKKRLVVSKFCSILERLGEYEEHMCSVCLDSFTNADEIRELCSCDHVFHKECIDTWLDQGQFTCPLCRSMLFPDNILTAERNALLADADHLD